MQESTKIILWLGETAGYWIQTVAIVLSAFSAIAIIYNNSHQAKKRATVDLVLHELSNPLLIEAKKHVRALRESGADVTKLSCCENKDKAENGYIKTLLNNYEFIAAGIKEGAFDEEIYKRMTRSILIRDWDAFSAYVAELRRQTEREKIYAEFQWLVERWKRSEIKSEVWWPRRFINRIGL